MKNLLALFIMLGFCGSALGSCGLPELISENIQNEIKNKIRVSLLDSNFAGKNSLSVLEVEVPDLYKDYLLSEAYVTYWTEGKPSFHASLVMEKGYTYNSDVKDDNSRRTGSKTFNVSVDNEALTKMKITLVYGDMCYSRYQLNIDDLENYKVLEDKTMNGIARQNRMFVKGRKQL